MKKYDSYKPVGIEWLDEMPSHWEAKRLKFVAEANPSNIDKKSVEGEKEVWLCNYMDVYKNDFITNEIDFMKATASNAQIERFRLEKDDVIATKDSESANDIGVAAWVAEDFENVVCGYHLTHIKPKNISGKYLFRLFQAKIVSAYFEVKANGVTRYALGTDAFNSLWVLLPPLPEQTAIAAYLDRKTAEIDQLIADKKRLIQLYEEEKTAIINQAVTKGIDASVSMKDSGIDGGDLRWLGDIPAHWEVKRLRYLGVCHNGISIGAEYFGKGYPFVSYSDVYKNTTITRGIKGLVESSDSDRLNYTVEEGDVFFTRTSETIEEIGIAATCLETISNAVFAGFLIRFRQNKRVLIKDFSKFYFRAQVHRRYFVKEMNLVTRASLSQDLLKKMPVLIPPLPEQHAIVHYIESEYARIDLKKAKAQKLIELLIEYKQTLISEAVTGKIKVMD